MKAFFHILIEPILVGFLLGAITIEAYIYRDVIVGFMTEHYLLTFVLFSIISIRYCIWRVGETWPHSGVILRIWIRKLINLKHSTR